MTIRFIPALLAAALALPGPAAAAPPNIVVVIGDDLRHDICDLGMRRVCDATAGGREYVNAFTCHSVCAPARMCFLTGQTTAQHGVYGDKAKLADRFGLLPAQLAEAGYWTAIYGKHPQGLDFRLDRVGFDDWAVFYRDEEGPNRYFDPLLDTPDGPRQRRGYTSTIIGADCLQAIERAPQPFFVVCADVGPHAPNTPAPEHVGSCADLAFPVAGRPSFNEADLGDKPAWFDPPPFDAGKAAQQAEKWRTTCETQQEADRWWSALIRKAGPETVVMVTSDHGSQFGEHRTTGKNLAYDESIRVPLIVWGGDFRPGRDARLVSTTDLTATILTLAGAEPGRRPDPEARDLRGERRRSVSGTAKWGENEVQPGPTGLTHWRAEHGWRYFRHEPDGGEELYDMRRDPWQVDSLATGSR